MHIAVALPVAGSKDTARTTRLVLQAALHVTHQAVTGLGLVTGLLVVPLFGATCRVRGHDPVPCSDVVYCRRCLKPQGAVT